MIVVMHPDAGESQIDKVVELVRELGLKEQVIHGSELTVVAVIGDDRKKDRSVFETLPGVKKVVPILAPYKLASVESHPEPTVVTIGQTCRIGDTQLPVIAGPCSVESEQQIVDLAIACRQMGVSAIRGGAFKPRTTPYSFQGHGEDGLKMLANARQVSGLPVVTEVVSVEDVELVARYADCLQVGTRNAQNFRLLERVGKQDKPVLLKRGWANTLDEYLHAAEYILDAGNPNVILCERGVRTFETHCRNTFAISAIAELKRRSHLPVIADPSHATGHAHLVPPMCYAAIAAGADGLILEIHRDPSHAMTDGAQSLTPAQLAQAMDVMRRVAESVDRAMAADQPD